MTTQESTAQKATAQRAGTHRASIIGRCLWCAGSIGAMGFALYLAAHHPLGPTGAVGVLLAWVLAALRWRGLYLYALPAVLPLLNFSPWTGWIGVEEFDMAVAGAAAAGFARIAIDRPSPPPALSSRARLALASIVALTMIGMWRGVVDAGGLPLGWFQGYTEPLNAWRSGKSWLLALLMLPLLRRDWLADRDDAMRRLASGIVTGAVIVAVVVVRERAAYPGLFDISARYRTVALFWEMHVGGAAIDAYVVVCTPFVAWALWAARSWWQWLLAATFSLVWAYVCLTTFARGAYLGVAAGLVALGLLLPIEGTRGRLLARALSLLLGAALMLATALEVWGYPAALFVFTALLAASWWRWRARPGQPRRRPAVALLGLALVFEAIVLVGPDSFMRQRVAASSLDYEGRRAHWTRGIGLLVGAEAWAWGLGLGRLPARYDREALRGEFPGTVTWLDDETSAHVRVAGPRAGGRQRGHFGLTQRVSLESAYRLRLDVRPAGAVIWVSVCESHLLYNRNCQATVITAARTARSGWHTVEVVLAGPPLNAGSWYAPRGAVLTLTVIGAGRQTEVDNVSLETPDGRQLVRNGGFADGLAHWLPAAQSHFVPWHIDNMYLELLIERGLVGLLVVLAVLAGTAPAVIRLSARGDAWTAFAGASLAGLCVLGLASSVFDVPRVAWLGTVLLLGVALSRPAPEPAETLEKRG